MNLFDLAIVGIGATGISLLQHIQEEVYSLGLPAPSLILFCPNAYFARGKAFGDADIMHRVNTATCLLSISEKDPAGFTRWMKENGTANNEHYPHRLIYAHFLYKTYQDIKNSGLLDIEEVHATVQTIGRHSNGYQLHSDNGKMAVARQVVLCLGSLHGTFFPSLVKTIGFMNHHSQYDSIQSGPVIVAGTSLTAVDAFLSLNSAEDREIHLFSRHGFAPTCLSSEHHYIPKLVTWPTFLQRHKGQVQIEHFTKILKAECKLLLKQENEQIEAIHLLKKHGLAPYFEYLMLRSKAADLPYQDILISTRPYMHRIWQSMSIKDRIHFHTHYGAAWVAWRYPIPYEIMTKLFAAASAGRLHIHRTIKSPLWVNGKFTITTEHGRIIKASTLIDGTGGSNNLHTIRSPLLHSLSQQKLIEAHPCGGINIHPTTFQCRVSGITVPGLYSLGPLNKGCLFSTNAFWFNALCASHLARQWALEFSYKIKST